MEFGGRAIYVDRKNLAELRERYSKLPETPFADYDLGDKNYLHISTKQIY